ncbi:acyltransferase [Nostocaceae cyanobacterium CENA369]|uniref:Acyltransferase n=1 Tax=Dendronalium phyllosphericum CENA369 TaxID=1725256 RepID=A0A8J7IBY2_9NOST|nr:acyltransferase [Dendronalium phyllosphericum]MBH8576306.1 acyltransferase [Dendronalium phyllosphericum CENA369]
MTSQKITYIYALDGLRGIATLMIVFFHFNWQLFNPLLVKIAVFGQTGVDLFFVLSGFLITRILLNTKSHDNFFKNFYIRRLLRIFPLYYGFLIITYFILPLFKIGDIPPLSHQLWYYLYMQNIPATFIGFSSSGPGHFWSLAIEEHFYFFWPVLVYLLPTKRLIWAATGIILLSIVVRIVLINFDIGVFFFTLCRFDALAIGALLAYFEYTNKLISYRKYFLNIGVFSFVLLLISWLFTGGQHLDWLQVVKFTIIAVFYFCVVGYVAIQYPHNLISRIVGNRFFVFTGKISYGLYVFHPLIFTFIQNQNYNFYVTLLLSISFSYLTAYVSYVMYEKPFLKLKRYFEYV